MVVPVAAAVAKSLGAGAVKSMMANQLPSMAQSMAQSMAPVAQMGPPVPGYQAQFNQSMAPPVPGYVTPSQAHFNQFGYQPVAPTGAQMRQFHQPPHQYSHASKAAGSSVNTFMIILKPLLPYLILGLLAYWVFNKFFGGSGALGGIGSAIGGIGNGVGGIGSAIGDSFGPALGGIGNAANGLTGGLFSGEGDTLSMMQSPAAAYATGGVAPAMGAVISFAQDGGKCKKEILETCPAINPPNTHKMCRNDMCYTGDVGEHCHLSRDCKHDHFCNTKSHKCTKGNPGEPCNAPDQCRVRDGLTSGICIDNLCQHGNKGARCNQDRDCKTGKCSHNKTCSDGGVGSDCKFNKDCKLSNNKTGFCNTHNGKNKCTEGKQGDECNDRNQCARMEGFGEGKCIAYKCQTGGLGSACNINKDCKTGFLCNRLQNVCHEGKQGDTCKDKTDCIKGSFNEGKCIGGICHTGAVGSKCNRTEDCVSINPALPFGFCNTHKKVNVCTTGVPGTGCGSDVNCAPLEGTWSNGTGKCVEKICRDGAPNAMCRDDNDCAPQEGIQACISTNNAKRCSGGQKGDRCRRPGHCSSGLCIGDKCRDGSHGERCNRSEDCTPLPNGNRVCRPGGGGNVCSDGRAGASCGRDHDCQGNKCKDDKCYEVSCKYHPWMVPPPGKLEECAAKKDRGTCMHLHGQTKCLWH